MEDTSEIQIALASDANCSHGLLVTAASIAMYATKEGLLVFNILDGGLSSEQYRLLKTTVLTLHKNSQFNRIVITSEMLREYEGTSYYGKMTYARLLLPVLLPKVHHVVYSDVDILWMRDVFDLGLKIDDDCPMRAVHDVNPKTLSREGVWFQRNGLDYNADTYFCAGLCVINLQWFRAHDMTRRIIEFAAGHRDTQYADQSTLNALLYGLVGLIPKEWMTFSYDLNTEDRVVVHYAGDAPWKNLIGTRMLTDAALLWFAFDAVIRHQSLWSSLRRFYSFRQIVAGRIVFLLATARFSRTVFDFLVMLMGRGKSWSETKVYARKLPWVRNRMQEWHSAMLTGKSDCTFETFNQT